MAVVCFHGMGQQRRYETIAALVDSIFLQVRQESDRAAEKLDTLSKTDPGADELKRIKNRVTD